MLNFKAKTASIINCILGVIHVIVFFVANKSFEGHKYGSPDRFGDYARGFYSSEIETAGICTLILCAIVAAMIVMIFLQFNNWKLKKDNNDNETKENKMPFMITREKTDKKENDLSDFDYIALFGVPVICCIGSIIDLLRLLPLL